MDDRGIEVLFSTAPRPLYPQGNSHWQTRCTGQLGGARRRPGSCEAGNRTPIPRSFTRSLVVGLIESVNLALNLFNEANLLLCLIP
jgi:hypothetical protein